MLPSMVRSATLSVAGIMVAAATIGLAVASAGATAESTSAAPTARATQSRPARARPARARPARARPARARPAQPPNRGVGGRRLATSGVVVAYPPGAPRLPGVPASAYVIADAGSGQVLAAKDPHGLFPPASTLKVLTAITMLPRLNPNSTVLATKQAASVEPNIVDLIPGHRYRVADLFRALLMISANDAAVSLVQASGSFGRGMALLNAEARHLQADDVVAKTPNGLPAPGQVVSAYDLALIARQALADPAFMRYDSTLTARFSISKRQQVILLNQNYLLTQYRGGIGGKIGWTLKAEATYIGLARRNGVTLIVTILHATPLTEIVSAEKLLDWGFAMHGKAGPVGTLVPPLALARPAGRTHPSRPAAHPGSLAGAQAAHQLAAASLSHPAVGAGIAAGLSFGVLAGFAWLRRRGKSTRPGGNRLAP